MKLVIIGVFECDKKSPFPTHAPPILAEESDKGFRRVFYDAKFKPLETPGDGKWEQNPGNLLSNISAIRINPKPYKLGDQVVYAGKGEVIVGSNRLIIIISLLPHIFSSRLRITMRTIINTFV